MFTVAQIPQSLFMGDWMVSIDLRATLFHIPILPSHNRFLCFMMGAKSITSSRLSHLDSTSAFREFTKVVAEVAAHIQKQGGQVIPYLDDWLIKGSPEEETLTYLSLTCSLLSQPGTLA